ncbi:hypothetical protein [Mycobacterium marinum]|uniref:hypothetical protein n=1 Tax=Mycobacterium marinum TaxID=1781 RepID=UPI002AB21461|nr:hypothetical protein [Mycobacterium marinum]
MYTGPGSASLRAASASWNSVSVGLLRPPTPPAWALKAPQWPTPPPMWPLTAATG